MGDLSVDFISATLFNAENPNINSQEKRMSRLEAL